MPECSKKADQEMNPAEVMAELHALRSEVRRLQLTFSIGLGIALVLLGIGPVIDSELWADLYNWLFVAAGIFVAACPYFYYTRKRRAEAAALRAKLSHQRPVVQT